ncbi:MAG: MFS transporter [Candidatus Bathyarchaeia archaeon]
MGTNGFDYRSRVFWVLWIVNFVFTFAVSIISTPRPYLAKEFVSGGDVEAATMEAYGIMLSLGFVAVTLGYLLGGFAADWVGRKRVIALSFFILAFGCGLFTIAPNLSFLFLASFVEMFSVGFSGPAISALVADYSAQCSRGKAFGIFNLSWVSAQVPAPLLGGFLAETVNLRSPFIIAVFVSVVGMMFSILLKGKSDKNKQASEEHQTSFEEPDPKPLMPLLRVILLFSIANLANGLLNGFVGPLLSGFLIFKLNADPTMYGLILSISSSLVTGLVQIPGGILTDKFGRKPLVLLGFLGVPLVFALAFSRTFLEFGLIMSGISAVGNISSPAISAWLMDLVPQHRRASVSGITQTLNGVGLSIGPTTGSYVWNLTKPDATTPCGIAALIFAVQLPFYLMLRETKKEAHQSEKA